MRRPLLWFVVSWIIGSVVSFNWPIMTVPIWLAVTACITAVILWLRKPPYATIWVAALLFIAAFGYTELRDGRNITSLLSIDENLDKLSGSEVNVEGAIASEVVVDGDRATFVLAASSLSFRDAPQLPLHERMRVSVRLLKQPEQATAGLWERTDIVKISGGVILRPEPSRNYGGFDYRLYLRHQHIHWLISAKGTDSVAVSEAVNELAPSRLLLWNDRLRMALAKRMESIFPADQSGLMKSMLIGRQDDIDPDQYTQFSKLGLTHILAISGMNVAVFLGLLFMLLKRLRMTRETSLWIGIALMPGYVLLTGATPSVVRAGLVAMLALFAARRGWLKDGLHLTAVAAWAMLIWEPYYMFDVGFQLSFLISAALLVGVPRIAKLLPIRNEAVRQAAALTIVSQLVSFPITVTYFNGFSLLSWLANSLFVPVFGAVLFPAALVSLFAGILWLPVGRLAGAACGFLSRLTVAAIDQLARLDGFQLIWPTPTPLWTSLYFILLIFLYLAVARRFARDHDIAWGSPYAAAPRSIWPIAAAIGALLLLLAHGYSPDRFSRNGWVEFLDVGQGDAALIRTPSGKYILIDGGGTLHFQKPGEEWKERRNPYEIGRSVVVPLLKQHGVHRLDYVIATHEDQDHIGGLQAVVEQIPIQTFVFNGTLKPEPNVKKLFQTLLDRKIPLVPATRLPQIRLDSQTELNMLMPINNDPNHSLRMATAQNNESIAFILSMQKFRWLFTGDMEKPEEEALLAALAAEDQLMRQQEFPSVDVLKVAHHGSKTSSTQPWLDRWQPKLAVISVGVRNTYGHPSPQVLQRLEMSGMTITRTDIEGAIHFAIINKQLQWKTKLGTTDEGSPR